MCSLSVFALSLTNGLIRQPTTSVMLRRRRRHHTNFSRHPMPPTIEPSMPACDSQIWRILSTLPLFAGCRSTLDLPLAGRSIRRILPLGLCAVMDGYFCVLSQTTLSLATKISSHIERFNSGPPMHALAYQNGSPVMFLTFVLSVLIPCAQLFPETGQVILNPPSQLF